MFEVFEHTADLGIRVRAPDRETLLAEAARALFSLLVVNLEAVRPVQERQIVLERQDDDSLLLFDWLSELLYRFETEHILLGEFAVRLADPGLHAVCRGEPVDRARHELDHEVKAITYHGLTVRAEPAGWLAEVIVDI
jgi:SHS2 domain-containing protein